MEIRKDQNMEKRMSIAEAVEQMDLTKSSVKTYIAKQAGCKPSEVDLNRSLTLSEMQELAAHYPKHRKRVVISIEADNPNPIVEVVGTWDAREIQMANRIYHSTFSNLKRALRLGSDFMAVRNKPSAEELREAKAQDFQKYGDGLNTIETERTE